MKKYLLSLVTLFAFALTVNAQCLVNQYTYGSADVSNPGVQQISTCNFTSEYAPVTGVVAGEDYEFTASDGAYITVANASNTIAYAWGYSPVQWTATITGSVNVHFNYDASCSQTSLGCVATTAEWTSGVVVPQPGDACDNAIEIGTTIQGGGLETTVYDASGFLTQFPPFCGTSPGSGPGMWFEFTTPDCDVDVTLETCGYDTKLNVYTGTCTGLVCVGGNDDTTNPSCAPFGESYVAFAGTANTTYYVYASAYSSFTNVVPADLMLGFTLDPCCSAGPLTATFVPDYITVCPGEPFSGTLVIEGGLQGPPSGLAINVNSGSNDVFLTSGDDGSTSAILGNIGGASAFRQGGAVVTSGPAADAPVMSNPFYYVDGTNVYKWQSGAETLVGAHGAGPNVTGLAWDWTTQTMYLATVLPSELYTMDINTGATTLVGPMTGMADFSIWIVTDDVGNMYSMDISTDQLYSINTATGAATAIGPIGFAANFGQDAFWWDGQIYSWSCGSFPYNYVSYDVTTGAATTVSPGVGAQIGVQGWMGQTFSGGYEVVWNDMTGITCTSDNCATFDGVLDVPGIYDYVVTVTDACGATTTATLTVEVLDSPDAMACNDHVTIAVYDNCLVDVRADMFLEGPYDGCYDLMEVYFWPFGDESLATGDVNNTDFDFSGLLNVEHMFVIYNPLTGNQCMGTFIAEDKITPTIDCGDELVVACYEAIPYVEPVVYDNCSNWELFHEDEVVDNGCAEYTYVVYRTWTVFDYNNGTSSSCTQVINMTRADLSNLAWPLNYDGLEGNEDMLECNSGYPVDGYGNPHPDFTGWPLGTAPQCGTIEVFYNDINYTSECGPKILREWTVIDDCTAEIVTHIQIIRITDTTAPTFMLPDNMVANTKGYVCNADFVIPDIMHLEDNCDLFPQWYATTDAGFIVGDANFNGYVDANETWTVLGVGLGEYQLCYTAVDWCGNFYTECITLTVEDDVPPIPVCEQYKQVSLTPLGDAKVYAEDFDSGSFDNCGPVWFKVLRGYEYNNNNELLYDGGCPSLNGDDNPFTTANDVWFDDDVFFCCDDLGLAHPDGIMVTLRVFDVDPGPGPVNPYDMYNPNGRLYGRFNDCWTVVQIECKIPPLVTAPDQEVSCEANIDPYVNTALFPDIVSVCGYEATYEDSDKKGDVCTGYIERTWTVTGCEKTVTKLQRIYLTATEAFNPCTISFPADDIDIVCPDNTGDPGYPTWDENPCNIVTAEIINIDTFTFVEGACYKIVVDWAVVDWCVYQPNTGAEDNLDEVRNRKLVCNSLVEDGYYRYTQILMVTDIYAPEIAVEDQCVATTNGCYAENVEMEAFATDTCNIDDKFWWKYIVTNMDTWETVQYSYNYIPAPADGRKGSRSKDNLDQTAEGKIAILDPLPIGNYRVEWTVGDGCGNASSTYQYFTVADKKPPTPFLVDISTALMSNGMVEMTARFFDKGACNDQCLASFDQCSDVIYFTFTPMLPAITPQWKFDIANGVYYFNPETGAESNRNAYLAGTAHSWDPFLNTAGKVFFCDDTPAVNVDVYVWDEFALNEDCNDGNYDFATILLNLNDDGDCENELVQVAGMITANHSGEGIDNVEVMIDKEGATEFPKYANTAAGAYAFNVYAGDYNVSASKTDDYSNGVTTLDLVLIQKHLLGLVPLTGDNMIAADANASGSVSAADLFELRELILGVKSELANNDSWVFVPGSQDIVANDDMTVNFGGIKVGDVNGSASANMNSVSIENRSANTISLVADEAAVEAGLVEVAFTAENFNNVYGGQFTLNVNGLTYAGVEAGAINVSDNNFGLVRDGVITMSWDIADGATVADGTVLFTLKLQSSVSGTLSNLISSSSDVTAAQAYTSDNLDINGLDVTFRGAETVSFELFQNEPNPFAETTVIGFNLPEAGDYTLTVFDVTGKVVKVVTTNGQKGYNSERLDRKDISSGVMYYQLESGEYTATKKMIIIE